MWGVGPLVHSLTTFGHELRQALLVLTLMVSIPIADTVNSELLEFIYVDSVLLDDRVQMFC